MTGLLLIPLMTFAAFGVDLASWYSRISYLQKSADAASLAGTVWMPGLPKATQEAEASLRRNGIVDGVDGMVVVIAQGTTSTSLKVTITDTDADRVFSQVFRGKQSLTRSAEAEYNVPLPLGSPLNYFGGDAVATTPTVPPTTYAVDWPTDFASRAPVNGPCDVGTSAAEGKGSWTSATAYNASSFLGGVRCEWTVSGSVVSGTTAVPPPDYSTRVPTNPTCRAYRDGNTANAVLGRWNSGSPPTWSTATGGSSGMCTWSNFTTTAASIPSFAGIQTPTNRPCRVGYETSGAGGGHWPSTGGFSTTTPNSVIGELHTAGNQLCRWRAVVTNTTPPTPPNPIPSDRSPGFWAMVYGPGQYAANGDAFSARCTSEFNCADPVQNAHYRALADPNRGYWYVVKIPTGVSGNVDINVFDASYNHVDPTRIMDSTEGSGTPDFETEYRVFKQTNPLDFTVRTDKFTASSNNPVDGGCWWKLRKEAGFFESWNKLCTLTGVAPGDTYLVNVRTNSVGAANEAGNNGYAIEAVSSGGRYANPGPSIYAYADMAIANQNQCTAATCDGTFYLAKVGPQYAGKTLVIEMYDAGDSTGVSTSTVYPMKPDPGASKPSLNVPSGDCEFTATADPNANITTSDLRIHTGARRVTTPTGPDSGDGSCGIRATVGGVRQFNGEWLRIRVDIPTTYNCNVNLNNPQSESNTCWWGIRYRFTTGNASDTTTWQARVEGNPVHLTE